MKLRPREREAILSGQHPEIVRRHDGACPFEVGEEIILRHQKTVHGHKIPYVSITITAKHRKSPKAWEAIYSIKDERGLYLAKGPGYTRSGALSVDPSAPVLDPEAQTRYAAQARLQAAERTVDPAEARRRQERAFRNELRDTLASLTPERQVELLASLKREIIRANNASDDVA